MRRILGSAILLLSIGLAAFALRDDLASAAASITPREIRAHIRFLAHDRLAGRGPGTAGGDLAALYIASQFEQAGLEAPGGEYLQPVALVGSRVDTAGLTLAFDVEGSPQPARYPEDLVLWTAGRDSTAAAHGELVFAGYGVRAPEHRWDDFKGQDLRGKILLILVDDPPAPPDEPDLFDGQSMTYYGRWTYKIEEAERQGAAGALLIHLPEATGYGWNVIRSSWGGERFSLPRDSGGPARLAVNGWVNGDFARRLLDSAGLSLAELSVRAARRDFRPIATGITFRTEVRSRIRRVGTANIVGLLPGRDPRLRDETVLVVSHYDHLGIGPVVDGDSIYNGAYDNASGVAVLLELADAFGHLQPRPPRSILFVASTAEEAGLLGAEHLARHPPAATGRAVATINIDGANLWGETDDVVAISADRSTLATTIARRAEELGMRLTDNPSPGTGLEFRLDHFPFARRGVPATSIGHGLHFRGRPDGWGEATLERYHADRYHRPADEFDPAWNLSGAVQQARLILFVAHDIAATTTPPQWSGRGAPARGTPAGGAPSRSAPPRTAPAARVGKNGAEPFLSRVGVAHVTSETR